MHILQGEFVGGFLRDNGADPTCKGVKDGFFAAFKVMTLEMVVFLNVGLW